MAADSLEAGKAFLQQEKLMLLDPELFGGGSPEDTGSSSSPMGKAEWVTLLRRQELLHRMEMERWSEALGEELWLPPPPFPPPSLLSEAVPLGGFCWVRRSVFRNFARRF